MTEMYEFEQIMEDLMSDGLAPLQLITQEKKLRKNVVFVM